MEAGFINIDVEGLFQGKRQGGNAVIESHAFDEYGGFLENRKDV
jgi:hypothetical protein